MDQDIEAQFARLGAVIEGATAALEPDAYEVMAQNAEALRVWLDCENQWRVVAGITGIVWLGLDFGAVDVVLRRSGIARADEVFADIVLMETAAMEVLGKAER
jgi:hypothetical protein